VTSKDWIVVEQSGETWIGSHGISMPDGASFPRGAYRAVLVDKGGDRAEREIFFDPPAAARRQFPSLAVSDGRYRVVSTYQKNSMVAYDVSARIRSFRSNQRRTCPLSWASRPSRSPLAEDEEAVAASPIREPERLY
jgi:hypothetical protein